MLSLYLPSVKILNEKGDPTFFNRTISALNYIEPGRCMLLLCWKQRARGSQNTTTQGPFTSSAAKAKLLVGVGIGGERDDINILGRRPRQNYAPPLSLSVTFSPTDPSRSLALPTKGEAKKRFFLSRPLSLSPVELCLTLWWAMSMRSTIEVLSSSSGRGSDWKRSISSFLTTTEEASKETSDHPGSGRKKVSSSLANPHI